MRNDPEAYRIRVKVERKDVHLMALGDQAGRELPGPMLQATSIWIEPLEDESNFHAEIIRNKQS